MIECPWCGSHTNPEKIANGDLICGRCRRAVEDGQQDNKRIKTMQTQECRDRISAKMHDRTRGWPALEADARIDPELTWVRLLDGRKYNVRRNG